MENLKNWINKNVPDQTGKTVVITGANSGLGFATSEILASKNAKIIMLCRNKSRGEEAIQKINKSVNNADLELIVTDLGDLTSINKTADTLNKNYKVIDILVNNAGVMIPPYSRTADGFELQFGTNHLGHFLLTALIFNLIKNSTGGRIVNVASLAHKWGNINFDDLNWEKRKYVNWKAYGDSKLANLYFTYFLADRLKKNNSGIITAAVHPGWTASELQRHSSIFSFMNNFFAQDIYMGSLPTVLAATNADIKNGEYYGPSGMMEWKGFPEKVKSNPLSHDIKTAEKLWDISEELTKTRFEL